MITLLSAYSQTDLHEYNPDTWTKFDNEEYEFEKGDLKIKVKDDGEFELEGLWNIKCNVPVYNIDNVKTFEWGHIESGNCNIKSFSNLIRKGNYLCIDKPVVTGSGFNKNSFYKDCIFFPAKLNESNKSVMDLSSIKIDEYLLNWKGSYDPGLSNLTLGLYACMNLSDTFTDSVNNNLGVAVGSPTSLSEGSCKIGKCYNFSGTSQYIEYGDDQFDFGTDTITINVWANEYDISSNGWLVDKLFSAYSLRGSAGSANERPRWFVSATGAGDVFPQPNDLGNNIWYMFTGVYNGTTVLLYQNGTLRGTDALTGTIDANSENLTIAAQAGGGDGVFEGKIDEVTIWTTALNSTQVSELYNNSVGVSCANIIASGDDAAPSATDEITITITSFSCIESNDSIFLEWEVSGNYSYSELFNSSTLLQNSSELNFTHENLTVGDTYQYTLNAFFNVTVFDTSSLSCTTTSIGLGVIGEDKLSEDLARNVFFISFITIIIITLLKFYNVLNLGELYDIKITFIIFILLLILYFFVLIVNLLHNTNLLIMSLFKLCNLLLLLNVLFTVIEVIFLVNEVGKQGMRGRFSTEDILK